MTRKGQKRLGLTLTTIPEGRYDDDVDPDDDDDEGGREDNGVSAAFGSRRLPQVVRPGACNDAEKMAQL